MASSSYEGSLAASEQVVASQGQTYTFDDVYISGLSGALSYPVTSSSATVLYTQGAMDASTVITRIDYAAAKASFSVYINRKHGGEPLITGFRVTVEYPDQPPDKRSESRYTFSSDKTSIGELAATSHKNLKYSLLFDIRQKGYGDEDITTSEKHAYLFVDSSKSPGIYGWGGTTINLGYKYNDALLPFVTKESCPVPSDVYTSGDHYLALSFTSVGSCWFKYDSHDGVCKYSLDSGSSWTKIGSGFDGVFVVLQGGGGGGGEAESRGAVYQDNPSGIGGGGGGGGAFCIVYLYLKAIPDGVVVATKGMGGALGGSGGEHTTGGSPGAYGGNGTASTLTYNGTLIVSAGGGSGGGGGGTGENSMSPAKGGGGGIFSNYTYQFSWVTLIACFDGKNGGASGSFTGTVGPTPSTSSTFKNRHGESGGSYSSSDQISVSILNSTQKIYRVGSPWATSYDSGAGGPEVYPGDGFSSAGGGGGASVLGQVKNDDPKSYWGWGLGGYGGAAYAGKSQPGLTGEEGLVGYITCTKI